ncbi:uncharacterized protein K02A2.6-like isoform X1 [Diaphorina citri]|uniref:RNA-directed DNA polymerase n=2 Tax=Diaphorina citri TaxID=121845 RepID=A0A1S3DTG6_DIACI|nr:uncharacterized protein K02A2.6-like isoform X1 [Diaphorina citri]
MDAAQLKAKRGTVKALLTKTRDRITEECTLQQLEVYEQNVEGYRTRYDNIQDELDELITGDEREAQDDYRFDIYESITGIKVQILDYKNKLLGTFASNLRTNTSSPGTQLSTTSNLTFVPYQKDETFTNFIKRLETFMILKGNTDNKLKVYILLHALSPHMHEKLYNMCAPEEPITKDYDVLVEMLKDYFEPRPSVWSLQNRFICRTQEPNESIFEYATELKKLSQHCNFTCEKCKHCTANAFLTLQFIRGLQDTDIRIQLLQEKNDATFQEFINKAVTIEFSKSENQVMSTTVPTSTSFNVQPTSHQVKENHNSNYMRKPPNSKLETNDGYFSKLAGKCYRCGQENHKANVCKFRSEFCRKCNKLGHIGRVCMSQARVANYRKSHQVYDELPIQNEEYEVNVLHNAKSDKFMVNIHIEDRQFCMEVDTGAALSSISYADYKALNIDNKIFKTNVQMKTYTGETIKPKGVCFVTCRYKRQTFVGKLYIINQDVDPIFGRDWIREISLDWAEIKLLKSEENLQLEEILKMYEDVFTDKIGTIPNEKGCLILKPDATPIFFKPRPVPYSRKEKIEKELDRLEKDGILTKVEHSDWGTPIVPIDKPNGDIRICADYKVTLNKCIQDMNYPIPRIDDIFAQMNGDLASILHPLNQLLRKGWKFTWTGECERSFNKVKEEICNENVLVHYNPDLPVTLATDASPIGLGAVLSHRYPDGSDRPIAFASRALTICEKNYSQIDKEATAIYWGIKKFFQYVYGRKFILITDNKPLTTIFNPYKSLPALSATRMLHYALFLSGFDYTIEYKRTSEHGNADYLSRFPQEPPDVHVPDQIYRFQANQIGTLNTITHQTIKQETKVDPNLSVILDALETGKCLKSLGYENTEITLQDGCLLKGTRVMIPATLRSNILQELHTGHLGMVKMKALGRSYCYWQNMDRDIEEMVRKCKYCCEKQNNPPKVQSHPWEPTREPWQRVHIDFAGPVNGLFYFIIVDTFSKWVEVIPTKTTTTDFCIKELRRLFTNFGICLVLVSDNGPQFTSHVFKNFLNSNGVIHKLSPAFHPASNGQAERSVQTIKNHLHCMADEPGDINLKISRLLMQLRKVPNAEGMSPYMLMLGRDVRTRLDILMKPAVSLVPENKSYKVSRSFHEGDRVQVRNYTRESKWKFGNVKRKEGAVHYWILLDDGRLWRRHVDQMRPTHYGGEG